LAVLAGLVFVIVNMFRYRHTSEINKFAVVGLIVLGIGAGIALSEMTIWASTAGRKLALFLLVAVLGMSGVIFPFQKLLSVEAGHRAPFSYQMIRPYFSSAYPVDPDDAQAVSFLRRHMRPSDIVYRAKGKAEPYVIWGGLPTQMTCYLYATEQKADDVYGLGKEKFAARRELDTISEDWLERLSAEHVTWVVADPEDAAINSMLDTPPGRNRAALVAHYGDIRVFNLH
jgi:hypothetical protein